MSETYFQWLARATQSRAWVNNPTAAEIDLALAQGAVGCTTNPGYGGGLLKRVPDEVRPVVQAAVRAHDDDEAAADQVQRALVARILPHWLPIHEASGGAMGWVSIQGAPERDTDGAVILAEAREALKLGVNCIPKIPATAPGFEAFETLVAENVATLMTEVFSLDQLIETCERYLRVSRAAGTSPVFIIAPITGIFGDHLKKIAKRDGIAADPAVLDWAGIAWSRAAKQLVTERAYPVSLLYGGARTTFDLTGLMGGPHAATINWSTFAEVLEEDPERREQVDDPVPAEILEQLSQFDDFRRALQIGSITVEEFEGYGPVQHFRDNFIAGWHGVLAMIRDERAALAGAAAR
ncbi:MAG: transaldolase family protein [Chloroflexota bacterium]